MWKCHVNFFMEYSMKKFITILFITFFIVSCGPVYTPRDPAELAQEAGSYPYNYQTLVKQYLEDKLFDPYTAYYKFESPSVSNYKNYGAWVGKVMINAKNRMGGYTGYASYWYIIVNGNVLGVTEYL